MPSPSGASSAALCLAAAALVALAPPAAGQRRRVDTLATVPITVARTSTRPWLTFPLAVTVLVPDSAKPGGRDAGLDELLADIPGLVVSSRNNPTQDPRLSIRGFGSRAAFGVRGVRVLRDGIPITLADGQTPTEYLDLQSVGSVEVLRGSASALYGNAAGGVIELHTADPPASGSEARARAWRTGEGESRVSGAIAGRGDNAAYRATVAYNQADGARRHARKRSYDFAGRVTGSLRATHWELLALGYDQPLGENPGALTKAELTADPEAADPAMVRKRGGKVVRQGQLGLKLQRDFGRASLEGMLTGGARSLDNPLPFAVIALDRRTAGVGIRFTSALTDGPQPLRLTAGADAQWMWDDRRNFANCADTVIVAPSAECPDPTSQRGAVEVEQRETVASAGPYAVLEAPLGRLTLLAGARLDAIHYSVHDALVTSTDPDDSGERTLTAVSPMASALLRLGLLHSAYVSLNRSFEAPTTTELANRPDGSAGFNSSLEPQRSFTIEAGVKGILEWLQYDLAAFETRVRDELVPFESPGGAGRTFFRNAGRTRRRGLEGKLMALRGPVSAGITGTLFDFRYQRFQQGAEDFAGRRIPGVPRQRLQWFATARHSSAFITADGTVASSAATDDANSVRVDGYSVMGIRAGIHARVGGSVISPVFGVENLADEIYVPSIAINASGGRYYEPAPGRTFFVALSVGGAW